MSTPSKSPSSASSALSTENSKYEYYTAGDSPFKSWSDLSNLEDDYEVLLGLMKNVSYERYLSTMCMGLAIFQTLEHTRPDNDFDEDETGAFQLFLGGLDSMADFFVSNSISVSCRG